MLSKSLWDQQGPYTGCPGIRKRPCLLLKESSCYRWNSESAVFSKILMIFLFPFGNHGLTGSSALAVPDFGNPEKCIKQGNGWKFGQLVLARARGWYLSIFFVLLQTLTKSPFFPQRMRNNWPLFFVFGSLKGLDCLVSKEFSFKHSMMLSVIGIRDLISLVQLKIKSYKVSMASLMCCTFKMFENSFKNLLQASFRPRVQICCWVLQGAGEPVSVGLPEGVQNSTGLIWNRCNWGK